MSSSGEEKPSEGRARRRLESTLGKLTRADVPGSNGLPDFQIDQPRSGQSGYVEVTSSVDKPRAVQRSGLRKAPAFSIPRRGDWQVYLRPQVDTRRLEDHKGLSAVLDEATQMVGLLTLSNASAATASLMQQIGIEGVRYAPSGRTPGRVSMSQGTTAAFGIRGLDLDAWLAAKLREPHVQKRIAKLARTKADEAHLYLEVDTTGQDGLGISIALDSANDPGAAPYELPTTEPLPPVTDLWIWPDCPGPGLHFERGRGWRVVPDKP